mmetsp:Transcript_140575/g.365844  ORF Transcript_140575/g.365844 Transcript_140575/m.365844 type:complete len:126 (+) Transcript_140575:3-380(+)
MCFSLLPWLVAADAAAEFQTTSILLIGTLLTCCMGSAYAVLFHCSSPKVARSRRHLRADLELSFPEVHTRDGGTCAICLSPITEDETCRQLKCEHYFHADCISQWWLHGPRSSLDCPTCRQPQLS